MYFVAFLEYVNAASLQAGLLPLVLYACVANFMFQEVRNRSFVEVVGVFLTRFLFLPFFEDAASRVSAPSFRRVDPFWYCLLLQRWKSCEFSRPQGYLRNMQSDKYTFFSFMIITVNHARALELNERVHCRNIRPLTLCIQCSPTEFQPETALGSSSTCNLPKRDLISK